MEFDGTATSHTQELAERYALQLGTQWVGRIDYKPEDERYGIELEWRNEDR